MAQGFAGTFPFMTVTFSLIKCTILDPDSIWHIHSLKLHAEKKRKHILRAREYKKHTPGFSSSPHKSPTLTNLFSCKPESKEISNLQTQMDKIQLAGWCETRTQTSQGSVRVKETAPLYLWEDSCFFWQRMTRLWEGKKKKKKSTGCSKTNPPACSLASAPERSRRCGLSHTCTFWT